MAKGKIETFGGLIRFLKAAGQIEREENITTIRTFRYCPVGGSGSYRGVLNTDYFNLYLEFNATADKNFGSIRNMQLFGKEKFPFLDPILMNVANKIGMPCGFEFKEYRGSEGYSIEVFDAGIFQQMGINSRNHEMGFLEKRISALCMSERQLRRVIHSEADRVIKDSEVKILG